MIEHVAMAIIATASVSDPEAVYSTVRSVVPWSHGWPS